MANQNFMGQEYYADPADVAKNKGISILSYFGILFLVPLLAAGKTSSYAKFHANQGLNLFIAEIGVSIIISVVKAIIYAILGSGFIYGLFNVIGILCWIALFALFIMGLINVCSGKMKELPLIGGIHLIK